MFGYFPALAKILNAHFSPQPNRGPKHGQFVARCLRSYIQLASFPSARAVLGGHRTVRRFLGYISLYRGRTAQKQKKPLSLTSAPVCQSPQFSARTAETGRAPHLCGRTESKADDFNSLGLGLGSVVIDGRFPPRPILYRPNIYGEQTNTSARTVLYE